MGCDSTCTSDVFMVTVRVLAAGCTNVQCGGPFMGDPSFFDFTAFSLFLCVYKELLVSHPVFVENVSIMTINIFLVM